MFVAAAEAKGEPIQPRKLGMNWKPKIPPGIPTASVIGGDPKETSALVSKPPKIAKSDGDKKAKPCISTERTSNEAVTALKMTVVSGHATGRNAESA